MAVAAQNAGKRHTSGKAAKGSRLPTLSVNGGYQDDHSTYRQEYYGGSSRSNLPQQRRYVYRPAQVPLFTRVKFPANREAVAREMQNKDLLTATERKVQLEVRAGLSNHRQQQNPTLAQLRLLEATQAKLEATLLGRQVWSGIIWKKLRRSRKKPMPNKTG